MSIRIFFRQLTRGRKRAVLTVLLLAAVTAFFVMSVNLYRNSVRNLQQVDEQYSTIAVMELYGEVDRYGQLVEPGSDSHIGYTSVGVKGYDFSQVLTARGVTGYDLRTKYGVYIPGYPARSTEDDLMYYEDVLLIRVTGSFPVKIPMAWTEDAEEFERDPNNRLEVAFVDSAVQYYQYQGSSPCGRVIDLWSKEAWSEALKQLNRSDETDYVVLYPGVDYVAFTIGFITWNYPANGWTDRLVGPLVLKPTISDYYYYDRQVDYRGQETIREYYNDDLSVVPFPIQRLEDVQNDPELAQAFRELAQACEINTCAYTAVLTDDLSGIPAFHLSGAWLQEGRMITEEEYVSGAKVCMVSAEMADLHGWKVGDQLEMYFFECAAFANSGDNVHWNKPAYTKETPGFCDEGTYELVGTFAQRQTVGTSEVARSTLELPWNAVYLPKNSVAAELPAEKQNVHGSQLTIYLKNGMIDEFSDDVEAMGLTQYRADQYVPKFSYFDQGYSVIQPGLESMGSTARLLLILSSVLLAVTCVLTAFFFANGEKQSVGIFRMLGGQQKQAVLAVMICALLLTALGAVLGAAAGHLLADRVGQKILSEQLTESQEAAAYQSFVVSGGSLDTSTLAAEPMPAVSALAALGGLLFPALVLAFVLRYIGKEPRALLPKGEG